MVTKLCVGWMVTSNVNRCPRAWKHHNLRIAPKNTARDPIASNKEGEKSGLCGWYVGLGEGIYASRIELDG